MAAPAAGLPWPGPGGTPGQGAPARGGRRMDVAARLRGLGLDRCEAAFRDHDMDAAVPPSLTAEDLREIGVASVGHRRRLLGRTWPSDVPRRCGDAQRPLPPTELPGIAPVGVGRGERGPWRCRAPPPPPPGGTVDEHGGGLHAAAAPRHRRRDGAAEVRVARAHRRLRGPQRLGGALRRAGDRRGDAGADAERHRCASDEAVAHRPDGVAAPRYGGGAR